MDSHVPGCPGGPPRAGLRPRRRLRPQRRWSPISGRAAHRARFSPCHRSPQEVAHIPACGNPRAPIVGTSAARTASSARCVPASTASTDAASSVGVGSSASPVAPSPAGGTYGRSAAVPKAVQYPAGGGRTRGRRPRSAGSGRAGAEGIVRGSAESGGISPRCEHPPDA